jgi:hypothetical protein
VESIEENKTKVGVIQLVQPPASLDAWFQVHYPTYTILKPLPHPSPSKAAPNPHIKIPHHYLFFLTPFLISASLSDSARLGRACAPGLLRRGGFFLAWGGSDAGRDIFLFLALRTGFAFLAGFGSEGRGCTGGMT